MNVDLGPARWRLLVCNTVGCLIWLIASVLPCIAQSDPITIARGALPTIAEKSAYTSTASGPEVAEFLTLLSERHPEATLSSIGETTERRSLDAIVLSKEPQLQLPLPESDPRLTVLILGGIHSGECDSKEAILSLTRDWLANPQKKRALLEAMVFVIVPNFNADGNERVGAQHRPGQEGPTGGMGTRENAMGLDLNRDFVKLESPEVRSLVRTLDAWDIDVLFDAHTTNGSLHQYDLTYDLPHNPAAHPKLQNWIRAEFLPTVTKQLESAGLPTFYYGNFSPDHKRWESFGHELRYSTEYMGVRSKIGILVESYSYASYQRRIEASYQFIDACVEQLRLRREQIRSLLATPAWDDNRIPIQGRIVAASDKVDVRGYAWGDTSTSEEKQDAEVDASHHDGVSKKELPSPRGAFPSPRDRNRKKEIVPSTYSVELVNVGEGKLHVTAPKYYFVPFDNAWAAGRLRLHGVELLESVDPRASEQREVSGYRVRSIRELPEFQGHAIKRFEVMEESFQISMQNGWLVPTDQPLGVLATCLLEPHADDSLAAWNFFDPSLNVDTIYPVCKVNDLPADWKSKPIAKLGQNDRQPRDMAFEKLTLEKLFKRGEKVAYTPTATSAPRWIADRDAYLIVQADRVWEVDCKTGAMSPFDKTSKLADALAKEDAFQDGKAASYRRNFSVFDPTFSHALIEQKNDLYLYTSETDSVKRLTRSPDGEKKVPTLSPDGKNVAYVQNGNLCVVHRETGETRALTRDGGGEILNGYLDWVYQEEVYGRGKFQAYWWSPDGKRLAFLRLDESPVPTFVIDNSIPFAQSLERMRYPKAGQNNPHVSLHVVSLETGAIQDVPLSDYAQDDRLVVRVGWSHSSPNVLVYQIQNRIQSFLHVWSFDCDKSENRKWLEESSPAWVDVIEEPRWLPDGSFLWLSDSASGRRHLYRVMQGGEKLPVTEGDWDIRELLWASEDRALVTARRSGLANTDLLAIDLATKSITELGEPGGNHRVSVHPRGDFWFDTWSDNDTPGELWLCDREGKRLRYLGGVKKDRLEYVRSKHPELFSIPARDGFAMQALLYKPSDWEARKVTGKMPVLIHVYGGPQAPTVENTWTHRSDLWHRWMAEQGIAVLLCDNRSALGRGNQDTWTIYQDMGRVELRDLEDAVKWLQGQSWVDAERIGMWGWSYGGYFTAYAMTHSKLFRAGVAGAPVTDWHNYDSIYTERYMSTPQLNPEGYRTSSAVGAAKHLQGRLMILHGEIDDNVHMANSMQLAQALQKGGKTFDLMIYPGNRHGITDPDQSEHQYRTMSEFFFRELLGKPLAP
ncbi:Prolyl tripeptidyl peptidase precursor [Pirellula sp. SH-Sr6A]|uniref:DPP IV N-terminal domain-containing protein n=1 Tax=Pirellula sp. SH-Sr6A TaxID=1632865 RepID=UPI00078B1CA7|nr:DPP IV N-terminal domain-containing protein [Pirellula sp. SH-Sr6A]AMV32959.1 Prolyl tripeptidyl peptidase precursor [Pirellula sp. SH-Sr6A]